MTKAEKMACYVVGAIGVIAWGIAIYLAIEVLL